MIVTVKGGLEAYVTPDGIPRLLAAFPTGEITKPLFSAAPSLPESEWYEFDKTRFEIPILNQGMHGSCVGHGAVSSLMLCRSVAGMQFQLLSPTFIYAHINGNRDAGSIPADAVNFLEKTGTCLITECGEEAIFLSQIKNIENLKKTASRFKLKRIYQIESWEQRVTAILLGFYLIDTVHVGNNYNVNEEGVAGASSGVGNHCIGGGEGLKKLRNGRWAIKYRNSWSEQWGVSGFMYHTEDHYSSQPQTECFAVMQVSRDLEDLTGLPGI